MYVLYIDLATPCIGLLMQNKQNSDISIMKNVEKQFIWNILNKTTLTTIASLHYYLIHWVKTHST